MHALVDGDLLLWEVTTGSVRYWSEHSPNDEIVPWELVENLFWDKLDSILLFSGSGFYNIFLSSLTNFRHELAVTKPYKGNRPNDHPQNYDNLKAYITSLSEHICINNLEADDMMGMLHTDDTIICSRDKDLRAIPGWIYSWELHLQPSFGPYKIIDPGWLTFDDGKLKGVGFKWFCAQMVTGDLTDNVPGVYRKGAKAAFKLLDDLETEQEMIDAVREMYDDDELFIEQGNLLWIVRKEDDEGPVIFERTKYANV